MCEGKADLHKKMWLMEKKLVRLQPALGMQILRPFSITNVLTRLTTLHLH